jgi:hypothetical protein
MEVLTEEFILLKLKILGNAGKLDPTAEALHNID